MSNIWNAPLLSLCTLMHCKHKNVLPLKHRYMYYTEPATPSRLLNLGISLVSFYQRAGGSPPPGCFGSNLPSFPLRAPATSEFLLTHVPGYAHGFSSLWGTFLNGEFTKYLSIAMWWPATGKLRTWSVLFFFTAILLSLAPSGYRICSVHCLTDFLRKSPTGKPPKKYIFSGPTSQAL